MSKRYFYYSDHEESVPWVAYCEKDEKGLKLLLKYSNFKIKSIPYDYVFFGFTCLVATNCAYFKTFKELRKYTYIMSGLVIKEEISDSQNQS